MLEVKGIAAKYTHMRRFWSDCRLCAISLECNMLYNMNMLIKHSANTECIHGVSDEFHSGWITHVWNIRWHSIADIWLYHKGELSTHDDVIKWKHFPRHWPFVRGIRRSPLWINGWVNDREAGDLKRYRTHYDVTAMSFIKPSDKYQCWVIETEWSIVISKLGHHWFG